MSSHRSRNAIAELLAAGRAKLIRPEWNICPYCAKDFDERDWTVHTGGKVAEPAAVVEKASTT